MSSPWFDAPAPLLPEILALNARWMGDKPAVICAGQELSWRRFHAGLCQVSNGLLDSGLGRGDRVAVLMDNSAEMIQVLFGIISAGAVAVPINTLVADRALAPMIDDCQARLVMASSAQAGRLAHARGQCRSVLEQGWISAGGGPAGWQDFGAWQNAQSAQDPGVALDDEDQCNIIYSSGTTGRPKGIVHTHRRRLDWFYDLALALRYDRASVNLCAIGLFSNISWAGMGCTLLTGGTVVIMPAFEPARWLREVRQHRVTHSAMVPVMFQRILEHEDFPAAEVGSIKSLMCCGSPLGVPLKQAIMRKLAPQLVELYGLTEGLVTTLEPEDAVHRPSSVGKPLFGTDLLILDDQDHPCATGEVGEIVGRGRILMAGYHGREQANREATWTDPEGRRWLRTGDIGRLDADGFLYLVDRKKDLIISGGQNIYPADIETVALAHPEISEAAVIGIDNPRWGESPLAVVVPAAGAGLDAGAVRTWLNEQLGKHQRVVGVVTLDALPRNANGKVLKRRLREQYRHWLCTTEQEST